MKDLINDLDNEEERKKVQAVLSKLDVQSPETIDDTGKSIVILSSAYFKEKGSLKIFLKDGTELDFSRYNYDMIKKFLGQNEVDEIFKAKCSKYGVSSENFAVNEDTWQLISSDARKTVLDDDEQEY